MLFYTLHFTNVLHFTEWAKTWHFNFVHLRQLLTDFQIFFTGTLCGQFAIM